MPGKYDAQYCELLRRFITQLHAKALLLLWKRLAHSLCVSVVFEWPVTISLQSLRLVRIISYKFTSKTGCEPRAAAVGGGKDLVIGEGEVDFHAIFKALVLSVSN